MTQKQYDRRKLQDIAVLKEKLPQVLHLLETTQPEKQSQSTVLDFMVENISAITAAINRGVTLKQITAILRDAVPDDSKNAVTERRVRAALSQLKISAEPKRHKRRATSAKIKYKKDTQPQQDNRTIYPSSQMQNSITEDYTLPKQEPSKDTQKLSPAIARVTDGIIQIEPSSQVSTEINPTEHPWTIRRES